MAITLLLVRHGETIYNAEGRYQGQSDIPLSESGRQQARRLAQRLVAARAGDSPGSPASLKRLLSNPAAIYASDLQRAQETARILADTLREPSEVRSLPLLRERQFGVWEGLTRSEIDARWPGAEPPEGAESWEQVWERMDGALEAIWQEHSRPPETVQTAAGEQSAPPPAIIVVGHGGSLRAFICRALGIGFDHVRRFRLDNTSLSIVEFWGPSLAESRGRLAVLNDTAHLE